MFGSVHNVARCAAAAATLWATTASAQWFPSSFNCDPCARSAAAVPIATASVAPISTAQCICPQPVQQTVYRDVPVTEYKKVQKTIKRPVIRTAYEDRKVTEYKQVSEMRVASVPSTEYQTVTECQQRTADLSQWRTTYQPVSKVSPCQYDARPTFLGWLNRTGYSMRSAFTPNYTRRREYVPNVVAYNVPVSRTVAVPTTKQVAYNVTKMVPVETTRKVAVNRVEWVEDTVTAYEPYTTTRTVAVGTTTTFAYGGSLGTTATALAPEPESQTAEEQTVPQRSARGESSSGGQRETPAQYNSFEREQPQQASPEGYEARSRSKSRPNFTKPAGGTPSVVRASGWRARKTDTPQELEGPALIAAQ